MKTIIALGYLLLGSQLFARPYVPHKGVPRVTFEISAVLPHPHSSFTQGLIFHEGHLIEGTGLKGRSRLLHYRPGDQDAKAFPPLPSPYFGEGIGVIDNSLFQLTWKSRKGFVYDLKDGLPLPESRKQFKFQGQGWGLCSSQHGTVISDGTSKLKFVQFNPYKVLRTITVHDQNGRVPKINELEWIGGVLAANVWKSDYIIGISPETGQVISALDFSEMNPQLDNVDAVLNGLAYDEEKERLFVTGKLWPKIYELKLN